MFTTKNTQHRRVSWDFRDTAVTSKIKDLFSTQTRKEAIEGRTSKRRFRRPSLLTPNAHCKLSDTASASRGHDGEQQEMPPSPAALRIHPECARSERLKESPRHTLPRIQLQFEVREHTSVQAKATLSSNACQIALDILEIVELILLHADRAADSKSRAAGGLELQAHKGALFSCLTVNNTFHQAALRVISRRTELHSLEQINTYSASPSQTYNLCRDLVVHRVKTCTQEEFDAIDQTRLQSLELYVCPKLVPNPKLLTSGTLYKVALPGCALVDDIVMSQLARNCPKLSILDLRACELVTDVGIIDIANHCQRLRYLNVGRVKRSEAITDRSIVQIGEKTSVETMGLAGCAISDQTVLALARHCGSRLERLSLNQCHKVTDFSMCELLRSAPKLQVLEIVGCKALRDAKTMCYFKLSSGALVETSDMFAIEMQLYEGEVKHELENLKKRLVKSHRRVSA